MTDYDIDYDPGVIYDELENFNKDFYENKGALKIEKNLDKKWLKIHQDATEEKSALKIKIKFFDVTPEATEEDEEIAKRYRIRFVKQKGNLKDWYEILDSMKKTVFTKEVGDEQEMILLAPRAH